MLIYIATLRYSKTPFFLILLILFILLSCYVKKQAKISIFTKKDIVILSIRQVYSSGLPGDSKINVL